MEKLATLDKLVLPLFCTLTFPDEYYQHTREPRHWKKVLKRLENRFRRAFPNLAYVWRLELVRRKSGKYIGQVFPHFHLLVYGSISEIEFRVWLAENWFDACGRLSEAHFKAGTQCKRVDNQRHLNSYVSKYMAKVDGETMDIGRVWGVVQAENLPWVKGLLVPLTDAEASQLIRYMRRYANLKGRDYRSLKIFCDADYWYKRLSEILYPP